MKNYEPRENSYSLNRLSPVAAGLSAARANMLPGMILQVSALLLVVGYYTIPPITHACAAIASFRAQSGILFSIISTSIFGGLIPFLYLRYNGATQPGTAWAQLPFFLLFWAWAGLASDVFYHAQALMFGSAANFPTIVKKMAVDQFLYTPLYTAPSQVLAYHWKDRMFSPNAFRGYDWNSFLKNKMPTTLLSTWAVWIPMVSIIYSLPSDLQIPLFNVVLCFWALLLASLTRPPVMRAIPVAA